MAAFDSQLCYRLAALRTRLRRASRSNSGPSRTLSNSKLTPTGPEWTTCPVTCLKERALNCKIKFNGVPGANSEEATLTRAPERLMSWRIPMQGDWAPTTTTLADVLTLRCHLRSFIPLA